MLKMSLDELRKNLTKLRYIGSNERIYIAHCNKIVGEIKFYNNIERMKAEVDFNRRSSKE